MREVEDLYNHTHVIISEFYFTFNTHLALSYLGYWKDDEEIKKELFFQSQIVHGGPPRTQNGILNIWFGRCFILSFLTFSDLTYRLHLQPHVPQMHYISDEPEEGDGGGEPSVDEETERSAINGERVEEQGVDEEPGSSDEKESAVPFLHPLRLRIECAAIGVLRRIVAPSLLVGIFVVDARRKTIRIPSVHGGVEGRRGRRGFEVEKKHVVYHREGVSMEHKIGKNNGEASKEWKRQTSVLNCH